MKILYYEGSLFDLSLSKVCLVHACNAQGVWGKGIALQMRHHYPYAFEHYKNVCARRHTDLLGKALVIAVPGSEIYVACLFTSYGYGTRRDLPEKILAYTQTALEDLVEKLPEDIPVFSCKFNSGNFSVPWEATEKLILGLKDDWVWNVTSI